MVTFYNNYSEGYEQPRHKDKVVTTSLNSEKFDQFLEKMESFDYEVGYIINGYEHRPDLISELFYNTPNYDWLIMWFNNINDPFQQLNVGDRLYIPIIPL